MSIIAVPELPLAMEQHVVKLRLSLLTSFLGAIFIHWTYLTGKVFHPVHVNLMRNKCFLKIQVYLCILLGANSSNVTKQKKTTKCLHTAPIVQVPISYDFQIQPGTVYLCYVFSISTIVFRFSHYQYNCCIQQRARICE